MFMGGMVSLVIVFASLGRWALNWRWVMVVAVKQQSILSYRHGRD